MFPASSIRVGDIPNGLNNGQRFSSVHSAGTCKKYEIKSVNEEEAIGDTQTYASSGPHIRFGKMMKSIRSNRINRQSTQSTQSIIWKC